VAGLNGDDEESGGVRVAARPLRVLIVARQPIARAGLRGLLEDSPHLTLVGQGQSASDTTVALAERTVDVVLSVWEGGHLDDALGLAALATGYGVPLVLMTSESAETRELAGALRAGARGVLLLDAGAEDVEAALRAVVRGLLVVDPLLGPAWPSVGMAELEEQDASGEPLTEREREVLALIALGLPNKSIAARLAISEHTVKFHVGSILAKLGAGSRTEAVTRAARRGWLAL
jgi:DNA-binding NarL/FixJ family response regulator